jgi:hypothetical protein
VKLLIDTCGPVGLDGEGSLESSDLPRVSSDLTHTPVEPTGIGRLKSSVDLGPMKVSSYFLNSHTVRIKSTKQQCADQLIGITETDLKDADSSYRQVAKKSKIDIRKSSFEHFEGIGLEAPVPSDNVQSHSTKRSGGGTPLSFEYRKCPISAGFEAC